MRLVALVQHARASDPVPISDVMNREASLFYCQVIGLAAGCRADLAALR
jgi:hypothetical protein